MRSLFATGISAWAAVLIVLLPILIITAGEIQERLRLRGSLLAEPVATVRNWLLPLAASWALLVLVIGVDANSFFARLLETVILVVLTIAALQILRYFIAEVRGRSQVSGSQGAPQLLMMVPRLIIVLGAGWYLFVAIWDVDLSGLFAALGVTSLVISLALQDTLSGLASGFLLTGDRPFKPGDWIEFDDIEGRVVDTNWRSSRIRDRNGDMVVVPNSSLAAATIVNFDEPARLHRVVVSLQVAYSNAPTDAKNMLLAAARATEGVLEDPPPQIRVVQIDDPLMGYDVQMWIDDYTIAPRVRSDFGALVWYQSHRMEVPLPSPAFDLFHHDPAQEAADAVLSTEEVVGRMRRAPLFSELDELDIREMASAAHPMRFRRGEIILAPGVVNRDVYVLWEGQAQIIVADRPGSFIALSDGDVFGLMGRSSRKAAPPEIRAVSDCEVIRIDAETAGAVMSRNSVLTDGVDQMMISRSRRLHPLPDTERIMAPEAMEFLGSLATGSGEVDPEPDNGEPTSGAST